MKRVNAIRKIENTTADLQDVFSAVSEFEMTPVPDFQEIAIRQADEEGTGPEYDTNLFATWNMPPQDISIRRYPANGLLF